MSDSPVPIPPEVIAALTAAVKEVFVTVLVGYVLATILYGISVTQVFLYFRNYPKDPGGIKFVVVLLWALDSAATGLVSYSLYSYLVKDFGKPAFEIDAIPRAFAAENGVTTAIIFITQMFFDYQIWIVSRNKTLTSIIAILSLSALVLGIVDTNNIYVNNNLQALDKKADNVIRGVIKGLCALADILMATGLIYYFRTKRTGVAKTEHILDKLVLYAASRGSLATLAQVLYFVIFTAFPHHVYWQPVHQILSKLYVNSVLASLNARNSIRVNEERPWTTSGGTTLPMHPRSTGTSNSQDAHSVPIIISKNVDVEQFGSSAKFNME